jgi:putative ABC transport system permease protein
MISLAGRDIVHSWGKFVLTGFGLGLLIGVTLTMAGVYRGMVDDARAAGQQRRRHLGGAARHAGTVCGAVEPARQTWAQPARHARRVARAANVTYLTMQVQRHWTHRWRFRGAGSAASDVRAMVVGIEPGSHPAEPAIWWPGRHITRSHYEAVADVATGFALGERIRIRRHDYTVVGLTRRMVSSGGDPMVFIPLKDAQEAQFLRDNDALWQRAATALPPTPLSTAPACPACSTR